MINLSSYGQIIIDRSISFISENRDTLMLPDDDLGREIANIWDNVNIIEKKPVIVYASEDIIAILKKRRIYYKNKI